MQMNDKKKYVAGLSIVSNVILSLLKIITGIFSGSLSIISEAIHSLSDFFAIGFEYIKTVQLSPLSISVYDFLMGLVHILLFFSIVKVLKRHIDKIHI